MPTSIEQKEMQIEPWLQYDGADHPSILKPSQGSLPIYLSSGIPNSTIFQIEINCNATIAMKLLDCYFDPFNETRDLLMQKEVDAGNTTYYWTPIYGERPHASEIGYSQTYVVVFTALERTAAVKARIIRFYQHEVSVSKIVYKSFLEPYFGYLGLALILIAFVAQWESSKVKHHEHTFNE